MAIVVQEKFLGREASDTGQGAGAFALTATEVGYIVRGTDDEKLAIEAVRTAVPTTWNGLERGEIDAEQIGPMEWVATVQYDPPGAEMEEGDSCYSFDTGGGTQHITQAKEHIADYAPAGKTATNHKGAIGVTSDGIEGCDVTVPVYRWSETHIIADAKVTQEYRLRLRDMTGKVNSAPWQGHAAGEAKFMSAVGSKRKRKGDWEIAFNFAASRNKTGMALGDITGIDKKGWEYLWVEYEREDDQAANRVAKRPIAVHVERVCDLDDFGKLEPDWTEYPP